MTEQEQPQHPAGGSAETVVTTVENPVATEMQSGNIAAAAIEENVGAEISAQNASDSGDVSAASSERVADNIVALSAPEPTASVPEIINVTTENTSTAGSPEADAEAAAKEAARQRPTLTPEEQAEADRIAAEKAAAKAAEKAAEAEKRKQHKEMLDGLYAELEKINAEGGIVEVSIIERIKGGLRAQYKDLRLFLPASHFSLKRTPTEAEMQAAVGQTVPAHISEIQKDEQGRKTVVVSRRKILTSEFFNAIKEGDVVEGKVVSIAPFGVFVDLNGIEGLIHISRLSNARVDDPSQIVKKGDTVKAKVLAVDKDSERISLSRRELEESPWLRAEQDFPPGKRVKGVVRRLSDFGAYIGLRPGIEGLLRNAELSWGRRVNHPSEMLTVGQELELLVISSSAETKRIALGLKQIQPNPWDNINDTLPVGTLTQATVRQSSPNGLVVSINADFDGFIPRSKIRNIGGKAKNYATGETFEATVIDINTENFSLILAPKYDEAELARDDRDNRPRRDRDDRPRRNDRERADATKQSDSESSVTFFDLLSEAEQKGLRAE